VASDAFTAVAGQGRPDTTVVNGVQACHQR